MLAFVFNLHSFSNKRINSIPMQTAQTEFYLDFNSCNINKANIDMFNKVCFVKCVVGNKKNY